MNKLEKIKQCKEDFEEYLGGSKMLIDIARSKRRSAEGVAIREKCAVHLRKIGYSYPVIGDVLNRHHVSIMQLCCPDLRKRANERSNQWYKDNKHLLRR